LASEPATTPAAAGDLISFLQALPDCRIRPGIRFPQWWMLLVAILAILSGQGSLVGMERFAKRHRQTLNELLGTEFGKSPSDSTFRLLLAQLDVTGFETLLRDWIAAQPGVAEELDTLVCDGKTLRGSIDETASGAARFIAQVSLYSQTLGVAIAQTTYATDAGGEIQALRRLLEAVELEGVLVQLRIPRFRAGSFCPSSLKPRRRMDRALWAEVMETYVSGVSTRKVAELVAALGCESGISKSEVRRICQGLDAQVQAFLSRPLEFSHYPYVYLDATYLHGRDAGINPKMCGSTSHQKSTNWPWSYH